MPRLVDHEQRRREIGQAAVHVVLERGLEGVTVRGIAATTGWSTGSLRHYFPDQDALRSYVMDAVTEALQQRVLPRLLRPRDEADVVERVASIVEELLPVDTVRREEYALWSAVVEWERARPAPQGSTTWQHQRALYRQCAAALRGHETVRGLTPESLRRHDDPAVETWAALMHTFVDGLASQMVDTPHEVTLDDARALLRAFLRTAVDTPPSE